MSADTGGAAVDAPVVVEVVTRDCGYGFSGHAVMSDGSLSFHTAHLHSTPAGAAQEVTRWVRLAACWRTLAARSTEAK